MKLLIVVILMGAVEVCLGECSPKAPVTSNQEEAKLKLIAELAVAFVRSGDSEDVYRQKYRWDAAHVARYCRGIAEAVYEK